MIHAGLEQYVIVSALMFALGFFGVLLRKNTLVIYMCLELMLVVASTLALVAFSRMYLNRHYLSDVVAGGALALAVAAFVLHRWPALDPRRGRDAGPGGRAAR